MTKVLHAAMRARVALDELVEVLRERRGMPESGRTPNVVLGQLLEDVLTFRDLSKLDEVIKREL